MRAHLGASHVLILSAMMLGRAAWSQDVVDSIQPSVVRANRDGRSTTWFHPRGCLVPSANGSIAFMTLQSIAGSDYFGPVHWSVSSDQARTWSEPMPIPGFGRVPIGGGVDEGVCDVVPDHHQPTGTVLAIGHNVHYKSGKLYNGVLPRYPVYASRRGDGSWSEKRKLVWDDPRGSQIYTSGCGQRLTLADGDLLLPVSFGSKKQPRRSVTTLRCAYDGTTVTVKEVGTELPGKAGRGLLEPSLAILDGIYYLTIRAEDGRGYVATSSDGLKWSDAVPWAWQNGEALTMSTTQQHWLTHSDALYLVYTRKSAENPTVVRWRAPLYMALVDRKSLRLVKDTERVVFPIKGDGVKDGKNVAYSGNFHTMPLSPRESLVTDGETFPANRYRGDQLQAIILWKTPNRLVK